MKKIILDTNFLMIPFKFKVDIFSEIDRIIQEKYTLNIIDRTIDELNKIKNSKLALSLSKKCNIIKTSSDLDVDSILVEIADDKTIIATNDKVLKQRLKKKNIQIITLKQKSHLILK